MLTLRGLSLFFNILPISNTGVGVSATYILASVYFLYYFYQLAYWDSKVPKRFIGLIQMQCSPSFDCNWGKQNDSTACWHQLHPQYWVLQQGKCLSYPPDCVGGVTESSNCVLFETPFTGRHPPLKGWPKNNHLLKPFSWAYP